MAVHDEVILSTSGMTDIISFDEVSILQDVYLCERNLLLSGYKTLLQIHAVAVDERNLPPLGYSALLHRHGRPRQCQRS